MRSYPRTDTTAGAGYTPDVTRPRSPVCTRVEVVALSSMSEYVPPGTVLTRRSRPEGVTVATERQGEDPPFYVAPVRGGAPPAYPALSQPEPPQNTPPDP